VECSAVVLTEFTWIPFHPCKMIYQRPEDPQHLENSFAIKASQCSGHLY